MDSPRISYAHPQPGLRSIQELTEQYPPFTGPIPERGRSRSKYPFDILNVGESRVIGTYSLELAKRLYSAKHVYEKNHHGMFRVFRADDQLVLQRIK